MVTHRAAPVQQMCVNFKLAAQEVASTQSLRDVPFDYNLLTSVVPGVDRNVGADSDSEDDGDAA